MYKIFLLSFFIMTSLFSKGNDNETKIVTDLSIVGILHHMEEANKNKMHLGYRYLKKQNEKLFRQNYKNELTFGDLQLEYYNKLIHDAKKAKNKYMNQKLTFTATSKFGKYDFEKGGFPIKLFTEGAARLAIELKRYNSAFSPVYLIFNNLDINNILLKMNKTQAKEFLKNGRDRNRRLTAVFTGYLRDVKVCDATGWKVIKYIKPSYNPRVGTSGTSCLMFDNESVRFTDW